MWLGNTHIITPDECKALYNRAWRHEIAKVLNDSKTDPQDIPGPVRRDPYVRDQLRYLATDGQSPVSSRQIFDFVNAIYDRTVNSIRARLEALLLTKASFTAIAGDLDLSEDIIQLYERLFFNVRDAEWKMSLGVCPRFMIALDGALEPDSSTTTESFWCLVGVRFGAGGLAGVWGWPTSHCGDEDPFEGSIEEAIESAQAPTILKKVLTNIIDVKSSVELFASNRMAILKKEETRIKWAELKLQKDREDREAAKKTVVDQVGVVQDMLSSHQPKRIEVKYSDADKEAMNLKLAEKAKAGTKAVSTVSKASKDKAIASLDAELQERIKEQAK